MESTLKRQTESLTRIDLNSPENAAILNNLPTLINDYPLQSDFRTVLKKKSLFFYKSLIEHLHPISEQCTQIQATNFALVSRLTHLQ